MPRKNVTVQSVVDRYIRTYPHALNAIEAVLKPYRLPDGRVQNDDGIIMELKRHEKAWRKMGAPKP